MIDTKNRIAVANIPVSYQRDQNFEFFNPHLINGRLKTVVNHFMRKKLISKPVLSNKLRYGKCMHVCQQTNKIYIYI